MSRKSLSQTLRRLERNGLITRQVRDTTPIAVEYALSALGVTPMTPFRALYGWTCDNMVEVDAARDAYDRRLGREQTSGLL